MLSLKFGPRSIRLTLSVATFPNLSHKFENNMLPSVRMHRPAQQLSPNCRRVSEKNMISPQHMPGPAQQFCLTVAQPQLRHCKFSYLCVATLALRAKSRVAEPLNLCKFQKNIFFNHAIGLTIHIKKNVSEKFISIWMLGLQRSSVSEGRIYKIHND